MFALCLSHNHLLIVDWLLKQHVDINPQTKGGATALLRACKRRNYEICKMLDRNGTDISIADKDGENPVTLASRDEILSKILPCKVVE